MDKFTKREVRRAVRREGRREIQRQLEDWERDALAMLMEWEMNEAEDQYSEQMLDLMLQRLGIPTADSRVELETAFRKLTTMPY